MHSRIRQARGDHAYTDLREVPNNKEYSMPCRWASSGRRLLAFDEGRQAGGLTGG
jgi:hypothetical protein